MHMAHAIALVRRDIGDPVQSFQSNALGDGMTVLYDLPPQNINPLNLTVTIINGPYTTVIQPTVVPGTVTLANPNGTSNFPAWNSTTNYNTGALVSYNGQYYQAQTSNTDSPPGSGIWSNPLTVYTLDSSNGVITFNIPPPNNATVIFAGQSWGMFTDADLESIVWDAQFQHCQGQKLTERYRTAQGFITYRETTKTLWNLPHAEENLVVTLADINALWILATDAATDVNVDTAEGTNINRQARYAQLMSHIQELTQKYETYCGQLGVGMYRVEVMNLRRVSRTNNRLVPIFREREYDDHRYPVRELPQIDSRDEDNSGVPSPVWNGLPL